MGEYEWSYAAITLAGSQHQRSDAAFTLGEYQRTNAAVALVAKRDGPALAGVGWARPRKTGSMLGPFDYALWIVGFLVEIAVVVCVFYGEISFGTYPLTIYMLCAAFVNCGQYFYVEQVRLYVATQYFYYYYYYGKPSIRSCCSGRSFSSTSRCSAR